jgi:LacI family transcriptional regulator
MGAHEPSGAVPAGGGNDQARPQASRRGRSRSRAGARSAGGGGPASGAPISIRDVAARAGVAVGTVSNVLNRPDIVAASTRERVHSAIKALGFVRNESARQLRAGRSRMIGLIVLDVANPFFTDVARGVEDEVTKSGLAVILCNSDDQVSRENSYLDLLEEHRVQGVLITPVDQDGTHLAELQARGTPVILVDSRGRAGGQCSVAVDDVYGGDVAVSHLLAGGHERIAYLGGPMNLRQVADRRDGALRALARAGASEADLIIIETPALNVAAGRAAGAAIADTEPARRPTAVFCANDLIALGLLQAMTQRAIKVPHDIAIVGYDDIDFAGAAAVPLSSVRQPRHEIGTTAAQLLLEEATAKEGHKHREVLFRPELEVRRSSQAPAIAAGRAGPDGRRLRRSRPGNRQAAAGPVVPPQTPGPPADAEPSGVLQPDGAVQPGAAALSGG